jgi:hypothetical protein
MKSSNSDPILSRCNTSNEMSIMKPGSTIDVEQLNQFHRLRVAAWHDVAQCVEAELPWQAIEANHYYNFILWHEEDVARRDDIPAARVREAKRNIDRYNQARNDAMEKIDDWIMDALPKSNLTVGIAGLHSETIGMMIDRLSIMALKEYHMLEQATRPDAGPEHRQKCAARVRVLQEQQADLTESLRALLDDIYAGRRRFKIYRQLKMYNDPALNPQLYAQQAPK